MILLPKIPSKLKNGSLKICDIKDLRLVILKASNLDYDVEIHVTRNYPLLHSELFCLFSFGNWKFENLPISSPLCIKMFFRPYIFVIQSKKVYRLSRTLIKIAFNSGGNCFFAYFSIFSLVSQGRYLVKSHICGILWRK